MAKIASKGSFTLSANIQNNATADLSQWRTLYACLLALLIGFSLFAPAAWAKDKNENDIESTLTVPGFQEVFVAIGKTSPGEVHQLKKAAVAYFAQSNPVDASAFRKFLRENPESPWRTAIQLNLGLVYYENGAFTDAIDAFGDAWHIGQEADGPQAKAMVDRAFGELIRMHARIGHADVIESLLAEAKDRKFVGPATEMVTGAREGLWVMHKRPEEAYWCGPAALKNVAMALKMNAATINLLDEAKSGTRGFSLSQLDDLAKKSNMPYGIAKRKNNAPIPLPAIIHWKLNHYAALIETKNGKYHVMDPTFGNDLWISEETLQKESDGYFIIASNKFSSDWETISKTEAETIYGMGSTTSSKPTYTCDCDKQSGGDGGDGHAMPTYSVHSMLVSLHIKDTPVGYASPRGQSMYTTLTYNQREADHLPANPPFFNFGNKWMFNWLSFIYENPSSVGAGVYLAVSGGGRLDYQGYSAATKQFLPEEKNGAILERVSSGQYIRRFKDGSTELYGYSDGAPDASSSRRIFLKEITDKYGNKTILNYEKIANGVRLLSVTDFSLNDLVGQVTQILYQNANPLLVTKIQDPYGRFAQITYTGGKLFSIIDAEGLTTNFGYNGDFINAMNTPYGSTTFAYGGTVDWSSQSITRWLDATDKYGRTERVEFANAQIGSSYDVMGAPTGSPSLYNGYLQWRNTFYWDKNTVARYCSNTANCLSTSYDKAEIMHWEHMNYLFPAWSNFASGVLESTKKPMESRVWYAYPSQSYGARIGALETPQYIGRLLDVESGVRPTQRTSYKRDMQGRVLCKADPENNITKYEYAANGIDLAFIKRRTDPVSGTSEADCSTGTYETIETINYYAPVDVHNIAHLIYQRIITLAPGVTSTTSFTYTATGQVETVTDNTGHITKYFYYGDGYLQKIRDMTNGVDLVSYTYYDGTETVGGKLQGRNLKIKINAKGFTETYAYDNLDRLRHIDYADGSYRQFDYNKLDMVTETDRSGDTIKRSFDDIRNLTAVNYYQGAVAVGQEKYTVGYSYYKNNALRYQTDGVGNITANVLDEQSRIKQVQRGVAANFSPGLATDFTFDDPDTNNTTYNYEETTSRLKSVKDAKGGLTQYAYDKADRIKTVTDANNVKTTYLYNQYGQLERENSPDRGSIQYIYDTAGRLTYKMYYTYTVPAAAVGAPLQTDKFTYDSLSRLTSIDYGNNGTIDRLYEYDLADHTYSMGRLSRITGYATDGVQVQYIMDYRYDVAGNVWKYELTQDNVTYITSYFYDNENQLTSITYPDGFGVRYDYAGEQVTGVYTRQNSNSPYQQLVSNVQYLPFGPMKSMQYANGLQLSVPHDKAYRPTDVDVNDSGATNIMDRTYGYNIFSSVSSIANHLNTSRSWGFDYDAAQRLDDVTGPLLSGGAYGHMALTYDNVGNRLTRTTQSNTPATVLSETYARYPATNRLDTVTNSIAASTRDLDYDARSNVTADTQPGSAKILNFDIQNRLSNVTQTGSPAALGAYVYNALGQRISKDVSVPHYRKIHYHYDLNGQLMAESNEWGVTIKRYINVAGKLAAVVVPDDDDNDGMSDVWENLHFGNLSQNGAADMDSDSTADIQEYFNNSNPWDADNDTLGDRWELAFVGNLTGVNNPTDNPDNDNLNNAQEWQAWRSPLAFDDQLPLDGTYKGVILHKRAVIQ